MVYKRYDHRNLITTRQKQQRPTIQSRRDGDVVELPSLSNNQRQNVSKSNNTGVHGRKKSRAIDGKRGVTLTVNNRFEFNEDRRSGDGESLSEDDDEDCEPVVTDIDNVVLFLQNKATKRKKMRIGEQLEDIKERMEKALSTYEEFGDALKQSSKVSLQSQGPHDTMDSDDEETQAIPIRKSINRLLETYTSVCREREDVLHTLHDSLFSEDIPEPDHDQQGTSINLLEMDKIATDISFTLQNVQIKSRQLQELNKRLLALSRKGKGVANLEKEKIQLEHDLNLQKKVVDQFKKLKIARVKRKERGDTWKFAANEIVDLLKTVRKEGSGHLEQLEREFQNLLEAFQAQIEQIDSLKAEQKVRKQAFSVLEKEKCAVESDNMLLQDQIELSNKDNKKKTTLIQKLTEDLRVSEEANKTLSAQNTAIAVANEEQIAKDEEIKVEKLSLLTKKCSLLEKKNNALESELRELKQNTTHETSTKKQTPVNQKSNVAIEASFKSTDGIQSQSNENGESQCSSCVSLNQRLKELRHELVFQRNRTDNSDSDLIELQEKLETSYEEIAHLRATAARNEGYTSTPPTRFNTPDDDVNASSVSHRGHIREGNANPQSQTTNLSECNTGDHDRSYVTPNEDNISSNNLPAGSDKRLKDIHTLTETKVMETKSTQANFNVATPKSHGHSLSTEDDNYDATISAAYNMMTNDSEFKENRGHMNEQISTLLKSVTGFVHASGRLIAKSKGLRTTENQSIPKATSTEKEDETKMRPKTGSLEKSQSTVSVDDRQKQHLHGRTRGERNKIDPEIAQGFRKIESRPSKPSEMPEVPIISVAANHVITREAIDVSQPKSIEDNHNAKSLDIHRPSTMMRRGSTREMTAVHLPIASVDCPTPSNFELTHVPSSIKANERHSFSQHDNAFHYRRQTLSTDPISRILHKDPDHDDLVPTTEHMQNESNRGPLNESWKGTFNILRMLSMSRVSGCSVLNQEVTSILNNTQLPESEKIKKQLDVVTRHATQILQIVASSVNMLTAENVAEALPADTPSQSPKTDLVKNEQKVRFPVVKSVDVRTPELKKDVEISKPDTPPPLETIQVIEKPKPSRPVGQVARKPKETLIDNQSVQPRRLTKPMPQNRNRMMEKHKRLVDRLLNSGATMKDVNTILGLSGKRSKENIEVSHSNISPNVNTRRTSRVPRHGTVITPIGFPMVTSSLNPGGKSITSSKTTAPQRSVPSFTAQKPRPSGARRKEGTGVMSWRSEQPMNQLLESSLSSKSITKLVERKPSKSTIKRKLSRSSQNNKTMFPPLAAKDLFNVTAVTK